MLYYCACFVSILMYQLIVTLNTSMKQSLSCAKIYTETKNCNFTLLSVWTAYYLCLLVCFSKCFKSLMPDTICVILPSYITHIKQKGFSLFTYTKPNLITPEVENNLFCLLSHNIHCF